MLERRVLGVRLCPAAVPSHELGCRPVRGRVSQTRSSLTIRLGAFLVAALLISACSGLPFGGGSSSGQESALTVDCRALARQGVTVCPPANPHFGSPHLVNHSQGLVSSALFNRYAQGLLRNLAYEQFALDTSQRSIYQLGLLATHRATNLLYSSDLAYISAAKKQHANLTSLPGPVSEIKLVAISSVDQGYIRSDGYVPSRLAWIVMWAGPSSIFTTTSSSFKLITSVRSGTSFLGWGSYQRTGDLGPIWRFGGSTPCGSDPVWQAVCNQ